MIFLLLLFFNVPVFSKSTDVCCVACILRKKGKQQRKRKRKNMQYNIGAAL